MPTRPLVTSYRQDLRLFPDRWHHVGLVLGVVFLIAVPFVANAYWLTIANDTLVTIVVAVAMMMPVVVCVKVMEMVWTLYHLIHSSSSSFIMFGSSTA